MEDPDSQFVFTINAMRVVKALEQVLSVSLRLRF